VSCRGDDDSAFEKNPTNMKNDPIRSSLWRLLGLLVNRFNYVDRVASLILRRTFKYEHFVPHAVELISKLATDYQKPAIVEALFK